MASYNYTFQSGDGVTPARLNDARTVSEIVNADINASAAIAGTKIAPNFGSQNVVTTGSVGIGTSSPERKLQLAGETAQFPIALQISATGHATSERAAIAIGDYQWLQDTVGNGTKDFALFDGRVGAGTRMLVTEAGNVGIGTSSPTSRLAVFTNSATDTVASIGNTAGNGWMGYVTSTGDMLYGLFTSGAITFRTSNITRVLIDNNGNLFAGYLSGGTTATGGIIKAKGYNTKAGAGSGLGANVFNINWASPSASLHIDDTNLGNIQVSSDHRIKRNVETQTSAAIDRIKQIRPVKYQHAAYGEIFQNDETVREGFIAHELAEVVPSAVEGEKDAPNQLQSLRLDALCAVLVKAVQELSAKVEALEAAQ